MDGCGSAKRSFIRCFSVKRESTTRRFARPSRAYAICLCLFLSAALLLSGCRKKEYYSVTDQWRDRWYTGDNQAASEAIKQLLRAIDEDDWDLFAATFTPELQQSADFSATLETFRENCPKGFSSVEREGGLGTSGSSNDYGKVEKHGDAHYTCIVDGEWYSLRIRFCYKDSESADRVGVTFFLIENLEANAISRKYGEEEYMVCELAPDADETVRRIANRGFLFTPTPERQISEEEFREVVKTKSFGRVIERFGPPNVTKKYSNCTGWDHYYELLPEDGEPRYAYICTESEQVGKIYSAYICSPDEAFYSSRRLDKD